MRDVQAMVRDVVKGDRDAEAFLLTFLDYCHEIDDSVDRDHPPDAHQTIAVHLNLLGALGKSQFFRDNYSLLFPVIAVSFLAWADSWRMDHSEELTHRLAGQVLKSQYQDVFYIAALIVGGWEHALAISTKYRDYHIEV